MATPSIASSSFAVILLSAVFGCLCVIIVFLWKVNRKSVVNHSTNANVDNLSDTGNDVNKRKSELTFRGKKKNVDRKWNESKATFTHEWLVSTLKGHAGNILDMDFSSNGKFLSSCSDDRCVLLWLTKEFQQKEHKSVKVNIEYDHGTQVKWSPDSKAFLINQANGNRVQVYKVGKKTDGTLGNISAVLEFPKHHDTDVISLGIACNGKFIMTCSSDTTIVIWTLKGEILSVIDTHQVNNYSACVSPCGRFVASSGFTPDVKVWEVCFDKNSQEFKEVIRAFELKGHRAGIYSFAFNNDSTRMATVSKDGTWKLWDTKVEYEKGQEPYLLTTGDLESASPSIIALSPDGRAVAVATKSSIGCFSGITSELDYKFENVHNCDITSLLFSPDGKYVLSAGGRFIRIFHNVVGYRAAIDDLQLNKINATNSNVRERIDAQINEAKSALNSILANEK